jgi:hypothetical protein
MLDRDYKCRSPPMFALLQVKHLANACQDDDDKYAVCDAECVEVIKVDTSENRLKEWATAYQYRHRAAVEDFNALDPGGEWGPEHARLFEEIVTKYRVAGTLDEETTFKIVRVDSGDSDEGADNEPAPLASGPTIDA